MLLVIDVGNTNIVLGIFKGKELMDHWRVSTDRLRTTDEYGVLIRNLFYLNGVNSDTAGHRTGRQDGHGH